MKGIKEEIWFFYSFGNGDYLGWGKDGAGLVLNHEEECVDIIDLDDFLSYWFREST